MKGNRLWVLMAAVVVAWCWGGGADSGMRPDSPGSPASGGWSVPFYPTPEKARLCGEPVPLDDPVVWERFDREFTIVVYGHAQVYLWLKRMNRYFPWVEEQLRRRGLPDDLKYLAVAESDLLFYARSPKGATGPWQFIKSTGRRYGLEQNGHVDERRDFEKATNGALAYLADLHGMFHNWALAMAAYNCGEGRVRRELERQRVGSYYQLDLPTETERYILRILAIKEVLSRPELYGYRLPQGAAYPEVAVDRVSVTVPHPVPIERAARAAGVPYRHFRLLNTAFISDTLPSGSHVIRVPRGSGERFRKQLQRIAPDRPSGGSGVVHHRVRKGESLGVIAERYKVSVNELRRWNNLKGDLIRHNQRLKIVK